MPWIAAYASGLGCDADARSYSADYLIACCDGKRHLVHIDANLTSVPVTLGDLGIDWGSIFGQGLNIGGALYAAHMAQQGSIPANQGIPEADQVALAVYARIDGLIPMVRSGAVAPAEAMALARQYQLAWTQYRAQTRDGRHSYLDQITGAVATKVSLVDRAASEYLAANAPIVPAVVTAVNATGASVPEAPVAVGFRVTPTMVLYGGGALIALALLYLMFR